MKYLNVFKSLLVMSCFGMASVANAQTARPLSFGAIGTGTVTNWYKDYVGVRFQVTTPLAIAGDKSYTTTNTDGTGWGAAPMSFSDTFKFGPVGDTDGCAPYPTGYFNSKVALVWRGSCEFGYKALQAQNAGAMAVVIVNNVAGGPVGMAAGASGSGVTIPVYMISLDDGLAIANRLNTGTTVVLNVIQNWGTGLANDLGFVPTGYSITANNAMPLSQLMATSRPAAYKNISGAFVANYGTRNATNVKLSSELRFTPTGGSSSTLLHTDSVVLGAFPTIDSIWAMFAPQYDIPAVTTNGKFDLKYTITSDSVDQFLGDNSLTYSFYATDSTWCKARYDMVKNEPISTFYTRPGSATAAPFIWTVPYYVSNGGSYMKNVQLSVVCSSSSALVQLLPGGDQLFTYVFKWTDTLGGGADSFMSNSELELVGVGLKTFDGISDSSFKTYTVEIGDTLGTGGAYPALAANSWYVVAAELPVSGGNSYSLGCDGVLNGYPRAYGRQHFPANNYREYYNSIWFGDRYNNTPMVDNGNAALYPWAFDGTGSYVIDSVMFDNQKGLIPSLAFRSTSFQNNVKEVKAAFSKFELYPNPTTDNINVAIGFDNTAAQVTYTILDGSARIVARDVHTNVLNETYKVNTSNLATGNYFMVVVADGKAMSKKFTVLR